MKCFSSTRILPRVRESSGPRTIELLTTKNTAIDANCLLCLQQEFVATVDAASSRMMIGTHNDWRSQSAAADMLLRSAIPVWRADSGAHRHNRDWLPSSNRRFSAAISRSPTASDVSCPSRALEWRTLATSSRAMASAR